MNGAEHLVREAHDYWESDRELPPRLEAQLAAAGFDVAALEQQFYNEGINQ